MGELTFLMDVDRNRNAFYGLAKQYFTAAKADIIDPPAAGQTLEGVLNHLATLKAEVKVINLVSHASGFGAMTFPLTVALQAQKRRSTIVDDLADAISKKWLAPPSPSIVSPNTRVVIYGCDVGRSLKFMTLLSTLLGNPGELLAPRRMSVFQLAAGKVVYRQAQTWTVVRKQLLTLTASFEPTEGWTKFREAFVKAALDKFGTAALGASGGGGDIQLEKNLKEIASTATFDLKPTFFIDESLNIEPDPPLTAQQIVNTAPTLTNGDPITTPPAGLGRVDDTGVMTTVVPKTDAIARDATRQRFRIDIMVLAKILDEQVVIGDNDGYRGMTTSPPRAPSPGPKPTGGGASTGSGGSPGDPSAFDEALRALLDELVADGAPQVDVDAILAAIPRGDATEGIDGEAEGADSPPLPDDLASRALPPDPMEPPEVA